MIKRFRVKLLVLVLMVAAASILWVTSAAWAGAEPGDNTRIVGKSLEAELTAILIDGEYEYVIQTIAGWCNKEYFVLGPLIANSTNSNSYGVITPSNFSSVEAKCSDVILNCVEGYVLLDAGPEGCYSDWGGEDLIITNVKDFINNGEVISAEVTLQVLETK